jgi:hypothetical protein
VKPSIHLHLVHSLSISGATPLLPIHAFMACTEMTLASSLTPKWCKRASKLVSVQAAVPSAVCVSHRLSVSLSYSLTVSLSHRPIFPLSLSHRLTLSLSLTVSLSLSLCLTICLSPSHRLCLSLSLSYRWSHRSHHELLTHHGHVQPSLTGPCNNTNCIVCEVRTGFSNTIQTAQHQNTAMFNFHYCITLYMFQTYSSLSRAA